MVGETRSAEFKFVRGCERTARQSALQMDNEWRVYTEGFQVMTTTKLKNVLITGATDGLGKGAALLLARRGYRVFATGRSAEKRRHLDELARQQRLALETLDMDVCDDASVKEGVAGGGGQSRGAVGLFAGVFGWVVIRKSGKFILVPTEKTRRGGFWRTPPPPRFENPRRH